MGLVVAVCIPLASAAPALHWQDTNQLNVRRYLHAVVVAGRFVYATGGFTPVGNWTSSVEYATILADGSLGPWQQTSAMTAPRYALSAAAANGYLYVMGGGPTASTASTSERAKILSDGSLGPWQLAGDLVIPRYQSAAVAVGRYLYLLGGSPVFGGIIASVERAEVMQDGSLGPWTLLPPLPVARTVHSAVATGNHIYLLGGGVADRNDKSTIYAEVLPDGSLGSWYPTSSLTRLRYNSGAGIIAGRVYVLGGLGGGPVQDCASVETAPILADGSLGAWEATTPMNTTRCNANTLASGTHLYAIGGYLGGGGSPANFLTSVEYASLAADIPMLSNRMLLLFVLLLATSGLPLLRR